MAGMALLLMATTTVAAASSGTVHWRPCPPAVTDGYSAAVMRCGAFEQGESLDGKPVRIRITRLQARPDRPTPHPIVYVPGGPGDPGGQRPQALQAWRRFQQRAGWPRDLVIFDPRGTGLSTPRPSCGQVKPEAGKDELAACFHALGADTVGDLGVDAQVADLHRLIAALGQGSATVWAESYGALIARRLALRHPDDVQAMILDSPVLHPKPLARRRAAAFRRRRQQLIAGCRAHLQCRLTAPSLGAVIDGLIAARRRDPTVISWARPPYRARTIELNGAVVRTLVMLTGYGGRDDAAVRRILRAAMTERAVLASLAGPLVALARRKHRTAPVYWSTRCQFTRTRSGAKPDTPCARWPVAPLAATAGNIAVPVLVISGERDILTPHDVAIRAVLAHPQWQFLSVAETGHGVLKRDPCARRAISRFVASGGAWLDTLRCPPALAGDKPERHANDAARAPR